MRLYDSFFNDDEASAILALINRPKCFGYGTLAAKATADADAKTTTTITYMINGRIYQKTATATIDLSATVAGLAATAGTGVQAAGKYAAYLFTLNAGGTWNAYKGDDATTAALALKALPAAPSGECPVGALVITNTTNPFVFGTTNSDADGVTFTAYEFYDTFNGLGSVFKDTVTQ